MRVTRYEWYFQCASVSKYDWETFEEKAIKIVHRHGGLIERFDAYDHDKTAILWVQFCDDHDNIDAVEKEIDAASIDIGGWGFNADVTHCDVAE